MRTPDGSDEEDDVERPAPDRIRTIAMRMLVELIASNGDVGTAGGKFVDPSFGPEAATSLLCEFGFAAAIAAAIATYGVVSRMMHYSASRLAAEERAAFVELTLVCMWFGGHTEHIANAMGGHTCRRLGLNAICRVFQRFAPGLDAAVKVLNAAGRLVYCLVGHEQWTHRADDGRIKEAMEDCILQAEADDEENAAAPPRGEEKEAQVLDVKRAPMLTVVLTSEDDQSQRERTLLQDVGRETSICQPSIVPRCNPDVITVKTEKRAVCFKYQGGEHEKEKLPTQVRFGHDALHKGGDPTSPAIRRLVALFFTQMWALVLASRNFRKNDRASQNKSERPARII